MEPTTASLPSYITPRRSLPVALIVTAYLVTRLLSTTLTPGVAFVSLSGNLFGRAGASLSGANFDVDTFGQGVPILDPQLLRNDLWRSLWYLHVRPPLLALAASEGLRAGRAGPAVGDVRN